MKKLLVALCCGAMLVGCGDSYDSITVKEFINDKTAKEQEKIGDYLAKKLPASKAQKLVWQLSSCQNSVLAQKRKVAEYTGDLYQEPAICSKKLGDLIKEAN